MKKIYAPNADVVILINKIICAESGSPSHCYGIGKIESAISTAFYPGEYPFIAGGIIQLAAVLCFYLIKSHAFMDGNKRTATLVAITFLNHNGFDLKYQINTNKNINELADVIEKCAASEIDKLELTKWFESHKIKFK